MQEWVASPAIISRQVGDWNTTTARWSIGIWAAFLTTRAMEKVYWQCQAENFVALQFIFAVNYAALMDGSTQSRSFLPKFNAFRFMNDPHSIDGKVFEKGNAVARKPTANVIFDLKAAHRNKCRGFKRLSFKLVKTYSQKKKFSLATVRHTYLNRHTVAHWIAPFV